MTIKKIFSHINILWAVLILFAGCKKSAESFLGPSKVPASSNFSVANNSFSIIRRNKISGADFPFVANMNFGINEQYYKATFSERVTWTFTMTALASGAQKVISGTSDFVDATNTLWDGSSTSERFFSKDDMVEIALGFEGNSLVLRDTFKITGTKNYNGTINGIKYFTVDDFDGNSSAAFSSFFVDLQDINGGNTGNNAYAEKALNGKFAYYMYGKDVNENTYIGSANTAAINDFPLGTFTTTNTDSLFINMYIYGFGLPNTTITVIAFENDPESPVGVFDATKSDRWLYQIPVEWTGWKLVSVPYSSFRRTNTQAGLGNNQLNPDKLCGLAIGLDSYPASGFQVEAVVDMVVITENGTFKK